MPLRPHHLLLAIAALAFALPLTSCKDMRQAKSLADPAVVDFHKQFNDKKFKDIYTASHPTFKAAAKEADFLKLMETIHKKLGKQVKSTEAGWKVNSYNFTTYAVLTQDTEFERGKGTETFTYVVDKGACTLNGYHINSQDLITLDAPPDKENPAPPAPNPPQQTPSPLETTPRP